LFLYDCIAITVLDGKSERANILSEICQESITVALSLFDSVIDRLLNGSITISLLNIICGEEKSFLELFKLIEKNTQSGATNVPESGLRDVDKSGVLLKVINWRRKEVEGFEKITELARHFGNMCTNIMSGELKKVEL